MHADPGSMQAVVQNFADRPAFDREAAQLSLMLQ